MKTSQNQCGIVGSFVKNNTVLGIFSLWSSFLKICCIYNYNDKMQTENFVVFYKIG